MGQDHLPRPSGCASGGKLTLTWPATAFLPRESSPARKQDIDTRRADWLVSVFYSICLPPARGLEPQFKAEGKMYDLY